MEASHEPALPSGQSPRDAAAIWIAADMNEHTHDELRRIGDLMKSHRLAALEGDWDKMAETRSDMVREVRGWCENNGCELPEDDEERKDLIWAHKRRAAVDLPYWKPAFRE